MNQIDLLQEMGLSQKEGYIYQILLKLGQSPAKKIVVEAEMPRGTVYEILAQLANKKLIEQFQNDKNVTIFRVRHPFALKEYIEDKKVKISQTEVKLDSIFNDFINLYSQNQSRPGVKFYEGKEGVKKVLWDSLLADNVYTYADMKPVVTYINDINQEYVKAREKKGIKKKVILLDTPFTRDYMKNYRLAPDDIKFIKNQDAPPFQTIMEIYDGKISYVTLSDKIMIGVIIEDRYIYEMHKYLFEHLWEII